MKGSFLIYTLAYALFATQVFAAEEKTLKERKEIIQQIKKLSLESSSGENEKEKQLAFITFKIDEEGLAKIHRSFEIFKREHKKEFKKLMAQVEQKFYKIHGKFANPEKFPKIIKSYFEQGIRKQCYPNDTVMCITYLLGGAVLAGAIGASAWAFIAGFITAAMGILSAHYVNKILRGLNEHHRTPAKTLLSCKGGEMSEDQKSITCPDGRIYKLKDEGVFNSLNRWIKKTTNSDDENAEPSSDSSGTAR